MENVEFINATEMIFTDISSEEFRVYEFDGCDVTIDEPLKLHVSASGGHRIFDAMGVSHYIPTGWKHLYWKSYPTKPNFVK